MPRLGVAAGLTKASLSLQLRCEITRKFAPYVAVSYDRLLEDTGRIAKRNGDERGQALVSFGVRSWF